MAYGDLPRKKRRCLSQASVMDKGTGLPSASPAPLFCPSTNILPLFPSHLPSLFLSHPTIPLGGIKFFFS